MSANCCLEPLVSGCVVVSHIDLCNMVRDVAFAGLSSWAVRPRYQSCELWLQLGVVQVALYAIGMFNVPIACFCCWGRACLAVKLVGCRERVDKWYSHVVDTNNSQTGVCDSETKIFSPVRA